MVKFIDKVEEQFSRAGGGQSRELLLNEYRLLQDEELWRLHSNVNILNTTELYTYEWLRW